MTKQNLQNGFFFKQIEKSIYVKGEVISCDGDLTFVLVDSIKSIKIAGRFSPGLDTLKDQVYVEDPVDGNTKLLITYFFKPIQEGTWKYMTLAEEMLKIEEYEKGFLVTK
ncbi:MAG: hypothetical protein EOP49_10235 [Sphingobacteriales bacterium]|nr:MAG: hypothetical protein EOP49_10235 [Sphingobacteriales bacterium]